MESVEECSLDEQSFSDEQSCSDEESGTDDETFYSKAKTYWSSVSPTINGVLGGFGHISSCDIKGSEEFLSKVFQSLEVLEPEPKTLINTHLKQEKAPGRQLALDCGAGIGRITKNLLVKYFETVDLIDQDEGFIDAAKKYVNSPRLGRLYCTGLQNFQPEEKYDLIWCQWVLGHLTDNDLYKFIKTCMGALKENGVIIVKENVTSGIEKEKDEVDSSVTRPYGLLTLMLQECGLNCIQKCTQTNFPKGLYRVKMLAFTL